MVRNLMLAKVNYNFPAEDVTQIVPFEAGPDEPDITNFLPAPYVRDLRSVIVYDASEWDAVVYVYASVLVDDTVVYEIVPVPTNNPYTARMAFHNLYPDFYRAHIFFWPNGDLALSTIPERPYVAYQRHIDNARKLMIADGIITQWPPEYKGD